MKIVFRAPLSADTFAGADDTAGAVFALSDVKPDALEPVGVSARDAAANPRQWSVDVTDLAVRADFKAGASIVASFLSKQPAGRVVLETVANEKLDETVNAVLIAGTLRIAKPKASKPGEGAFLESLLPAGCAVRAILFEPAGVYVAADLPAAFFPPPEFVPPNTTPETARRVVLRLPQGGGIDTETFSGTAARGPCWTFSDQSFSADCTWTARSWVRLHALTLKADPGNPTFIDSLSTGRTSAGPSACAVRLGRGPGPKEVRWVARAFDVKVGLAAGDGATRTDEAHFRPDVLTGAFVDAQRTSPVQFQALPRKSNGRPRWHTDYELGRADYRLVLDGQLAQHLAPQPMVAYRGSVGAGRAGGPQDAWLCAADGWLSVTGTDLLAPLGDAVVMHQFGGNLDVFAMVRAWTRRRSTPRRRSCNSPRSTSTTATRPTRGRPFRSPSRSPGGSGCTCGGRAWC